MSDPEVRTVTKRELVNRIAEETDLTKVVVRDVIQRFLDTLIEELAAGNRLEFREFGVFEVRERAARMAQNPRTLEKVEVPAKRVVKFKVGRVMRERVCDEESSPSVFDVADRELEGTSAVGGAELGGGSSQGRAGGARSGRAANGGSTAASNGAATHDGEADAHAAEEHAPARHAATADAAQQKPQPPQAPPKRPGSPF